MGRLVSGGVDGWEVDGWGGWWVEGLMGGRLVGGEVDGWGG